MDNNSGAKLYIDNVSFWHVYKESSGDVPERPDDPGTSDSSLIPEDAEELYTPVKAGVDFNNGVIPSSMTGAQSGNTSHTIVDVGDGNKALRVSKPAAGYAVAGLFAQVTETEENADTFVFECDVLVFEHGQVALYITNADVMTGSSNLYYTNIASDNSTNLSYGKSETVEGANAPMGKWMHFKLEYTKIEADGKVMGQTTITIGDTSAVIVKDDTIALDKVDRILFAMQSKTIHDVIYDNIVCKKICSATELPAE